MFLKYLKTNAKPTKSYEYHFCKTHHIWFLHFRKQLDQFVPQEVLHRGKHKTSKRTVSVTTASVKCLNQDMKCLASTESNQQNAFDLLSPLIIYLVIVFWSESFCSHWLFVIWIKINVGEITLLKKYFLMIDVWATVRGEHLLPGGQNLSCKKSPKESISCFYGTIILLSVQKI